MRGQCQTKDSVWSGSRLVSSRLAYIVKKQIFTIEDIESFVRGGVQAAGRVSLVACVLLRIFS